MSIRAVVFVGGNLTQRRKDAKTQRRKDAKTQRRKDAKTQRAQGARAVAFDILLGGLRRDQPPVQTAGGLIESDEFLALQMQYASNVVLAMTREVSPPGLFLTNAAALGDISTDKDADGILRRA